MLCFEKCSIYKRFKRMCLIKNAIKKSLIITFCLFLLYACHKKKNHPIACFEVENPVMSLGETLKLKICAITKTSYEWNMGDGTNYNTDPTSPPKHVYQAKGTYTIKLTVGEHISPLTHWAKPVTDETQQTVTVQ